MSASAAFAERLCACGTVLSRYNHSDRCSVCEQREEEAPPAVDLEELVAGLLLIHDARHPGESVNLHQQLAAFGIEADSFIVQAAIKRAERRHGVVARGVRGVPGYRLVEWEVRYRPAISRAGMLMERGANGCFSGAVALVLQRRRGEAEVAPPQEALFEPEASGSEG
jgi:hypothetical protein